VLVQDKLLELFTRVEGVRLSMVCDTGLKTFGENQTSDDVSTPLDRSLLLHLRTIADLAITDAATAEAESYKQSKFVDIEIWTKSGNARGFQSLAATGELHAITVVHVEDAAGRLEDLLATHKSILLEAGLTLSSTLASRQLIDEACITVTRAQNEPEALEALKHMQRTIGLEHLTQRSQVWLDETLFTRLQR
jgi:riboflavin biosynthesis pyrimidine reductase